MRVRINGKSAKNFTITLSVPRPAQPAQPPSPFARTQQLPDTVTNVQEVAPYYVVVKIPGEEHAEFVLMLPFTPKNKPNLTAWIAARCDLPQ